MTTRKSRARPLGNVMAQHRDQIADYTARIKRDLHEAERLARQMQAQRMTAIGTRNTAAKIASLTARALRLNVLVQIKLREMGTEAVDPDLDLLIEQ